ncbi:peptide ABC transporter substrate-binding protein [Bacteroidia bacterium]|nr:peptide ABC transporter substrate-binding protein [Bacteroidia bacterium]
MKPNYTKTCTLPQDLIPLLRNRGLHIADEPKAIDYLSHIGYFRFSAYLYPLLKEPKNEHHYKDGATFEMALNMYRFDRKLRILIFNEIEKIEVAIRSAMNNYISDGLHNVFWMTESRYFHNPVIFAKTLAQIQSELERTKEDFVLHFRHKYASAYPPAWMIAEILSLGTLVNLFNNLNQLSLRKKIARLFGLSLPVFSSWIVTLIGLRNACCHHARIWNKEHSIVPIAPQSPAFPWISDAAADMKRTYYRICMIKYLLFTISPHNTFTQKLSSLVAQYPTVDVRAMGFPAAWQDEPLWK